MEGFMVEITMLVYLCFFIFFLAGIIGAVIYIEKRLSHSSWFRNILALITGMGIVLVGLSIIYTIGNSLIHISETDFNYYLICLSAFASGMLVSVSGGYIAGKIIHQNEVVYGLTIGLGASSVFIGWFLFIKGLFSNLSLESYVWQLALSVVLVIVVVISSAALGGYFALKQRKQDQV